MNGKCPIQIVDDINNDKHRWITLDKYIYDGSHNKNNIKYPDGYYANLVDYMRGTNYDVRMLHDLVKARNRCPIYKSDNIRNPTMQELDEIKAILKKDNYRFNLKTYQLIKIK